MWCGSVVVEVAAAVVVVYVWCVVVVVVVCDVWCVCGGRVVVACGVVWCGGLKWGGRVVGAAARTRRTGTTWAAAASVLVATTSPLSTKTRRVARQDDR